MIDQPLFRQDRLLTSLTEWARRVANEHNSLASGRLNATRYGTAAPTTGTNAQGDFVRNSATTELGTGGSKYVIMGWVCVAAGEPGTWVESRALTGN